MGCSGKASLFGQQAIWGCRGKGGKGLGLRLGSNTGSCPQSNTITHYGHVETQVLLDFIATDNPRLITGNLSSSYIFLPYFFLNHPRHPDFMLHVLVRKQEKGGISVAN
jgi:hypothetical protein